MWFCEETNGQAPREGCRCAVCYRARERALSADLRELIIARRYPDPAKARAVGVADAIIERWLSIYLMGEISLVALPIQIIKSLAEQSDKLADDLMHTFMFQPILGKKVVPAGDSEHARVNETATDGPKTHDADTTA